jgi:hypothetical protein
MSSENKLPVKSSDEFIAECEVMDLADLKDKSFVVGVSQADRNGPKFVSSTMRGPYSFVEMCEEVGVMWAEHQHHAKVTILEKDRNKASKFLDENTVDYIEAHYTDIVTEAMLEGIFDEDKEFTCRAGIVETTTDDDPRVPKEEMPDTLGEEKL